MASSYSVTQADLRFSDTRLKQITDDAGQTIDATVVEEAILAAEEEFELYAGVYYSLPVRDGSGNQIAGLRRKIADAARWFLITRRTEALRNDEDEGEQWSARRKEWVRWLEQIGEADSKKRLMIPGAAEKSDAPARGGEAEVVGDDVVFSVESLGGFL
jgi:phage gp36-like protein